MLHRAWNSKGEMPYCFPRSSIKFQGHMALKIVQFDPNWAFPDCNFSLNSPMAMKCCTELETTKERCPIVFQGHPSNFKVTRDKTSLILSQIGHFRTIGRSQLSNPSDLPCCKTYGIFCYQVNIKQHFCNTHFWMYDYNFVSNNPNAYLSSLLWIFPWAPLKINRASRNIQGHLTAFWRFGISCSLNLFCFYLQVSLTVQATLVVTHGKMSLKTAQKVGCFCLSKGCGLIFYIQCYCHRHRRWL